MITSKVKGVTNMEWTQASNFLMKPSGEVILIYPSNRKHYELRELQRLVGGGSTAYIESIACPGSSSFMFVDEDGRMKGLPENKEATKMHMEAGGVGTVVGNAIIVPKSQVK